jgi:hypothetical protein
MFVNSTRQTKVMASPAYLIPLIPAFFILNLIVSGCTASQAPPTPPPDFQLVAEVDLSAHEYDQEILGEFTLANTDDAAILYTIPNIDTTYFELSLSGPDGNNHLILRSERYQTDENGGGMWEKTLPPGDYRLLLTAPQTPGTLSVYCKTSSYS